MNKKEYQKQLKEAAGRVQRELLDAAERESASCSVTPSSEFRKKMDRILYGQEKAGRFRGRRRVVAVVMTLFLAVICWLAVDGKARAAVIDWIREITGNRAVYTFNIKTEEGREVYKIYPTRISDKFTLEKEYWEDSYYSALYVNAGDKKQSFVMGVSNIQEDSPYQVIGEDARDKNQIIVKGIPIDCYVSSDNSESDYIWVDQANALFVFLSSSLPHEMNLEILESMIVQQK